MVSASLVSSTWIYEVTWILDVFLFFIYFSCSIPIQNDESIVAIMLSIILLPPSTTTSAIPPLLQGDNQEIPIIRRVQDSIYDQRAKSRRLKLIGIIPCVQRVWTSHVSAERSRAWHYYVLPNYRIPYSSARSPFCNLCRSFLNDIPYSMGHIIHKLTPRRSSPWVHYIRDCSWRMTIVRDRGCAESRLW